VRFRHNLIQQHLIQQHLIGGKEPSSQQLSVLRRTFLLYTPHTTAGWILHTLFYLIGLVFVYWSLGVGGSAGGYSARDFGWWAFFATPCVVVLLIIRAMARRNAAHNAAQPEEPNA
jgi:hypothetical protein